MATFDPREYEACKLNYFKYWKGNFDKSNSNMNQLRKLVRKQVENC